MMSSVTTGDNQSSLVYIHELVVRARQLASVAQLVRALHRNRRAADSTPARDLQLHFSQLFLVRSKGGFPVLARSSSQLAASACI